MNVKVGHSPASTPDPTTVIAGRAARGATDLPRTSPDLPLLLDVAADGFGDRTLTDLRESGLTAERIRRLIPRRWDLRRRPA